LNFTGFVSVKTHVSGDFIMKVIGSIVRKIITIPVALAVILLFGCFEVPETHRQSLVLIDPGTEMQIGLQAYSQALTENRVSRETRYFSPVQRVGTRLAAVANRPDFQWEFTLFDAPDTVNAWCLPGGKIGIYTGLFKVVKNEDQLAFVTGHEVGHAVARHGAERMSHQLILAVGAEVVAASMDDETQEDKERIERMRVAYGISSALFVMLPFSRKHEYEADRIGLMYMADAGYNPQEAITLEESFIEFHNQQGGGVPEYLSTHPSDTKRLAKMKELLPEAMQRYYRATGVTPPDAGEIGVSEDSNEEILGAKIQRGTRYNPKRKTFTGAKIEGD
jgi:metalloendopeptidase OMA1, mitochondrial